MNTFLLFACYITRSDPNLCAQSNCFDQITIAANAIAILTLYVFSTLAWTVFFQSFLPTWKALPLGVLCALIIVQVEAAMAASDWQLAGVLSTGLPSPVYWFRITLRLLTAWLFAQATAVGVTLGLFDGPIQTHLQQQLTAQNAPVETEYATRRNEIRSGIIGSIERELGAAQAARGRTEEDLRGLQVKKDNAQDHSDTAYIEEGREERGLDRPRGKGARYDDAKRHRDVAEGLKKSTTAEINRLQDSLKPLDSRIQELLKQKRTQARALQKAEKALEKEKLQDPRWIAKRDDPLLRYIALQELKQDARYGQAVEQFDWLAKIVLVTFELMFLLIKIVFKPPDGYLVRLIAQTKLEAAIELVELEAELGNLNRKRRKPDLRVVASD